MPFPDLADRLREIRDRVDAAVRRGGHGQAVTIVAVTKTHGPDAVQAAWDAGIEDVGENRVQEALPKMDAVSVPVRWHLIGHLQRNKVKSLAKFDLLHSLDSSRLADTVSEFGLGANAPVKALMQINVVGEESKGGYAPNDWQSEAERLRSLGGVRVLGVMTMAPLDADETTLRATFSGARRAREILCAAGHNATELSMGMSSDYEVAVEEGATYIRLGTILFGARPA
ncbi:MAG TPA: YggS family pyridoxal phosphate-dependent enzyme [Gemmatimonadaceae bacterium]|nr:YggS family pyridoxal phosphate-dependent enzyme [Gemmatimonadaceae bacterium]